MTNEPAAFKNQDVEFRAWVREHPRGRVVNVPHLMIYTEYSLRPVGWKC